MGQEAGILLHAKKECKRLGLRFFRNAPMPGVEAGWPDVIILGPKGCTGEVLWMETKAFKKPLRPIQSHRRGEIEERGGRYCKPDSKLEVTMILTKFMRGC